MIINFLYTTRRSLTCNARWQSLKEDGFLHLVQYLSDHFDSGEVGFLDMQYSYCATGAVIDVQWLGIKPVLMPIDVLAYEDIDRFLMLHDGGWRRDEQKSMIFAFDEYLNFWDAGNKRKYQATLKRLNKYEFT